MSDSRSAVLLTAPGSSGIWAYRHLILHKAWADFRAESQQNFLGILWWILDPIINTAIYYLVFGVFFAHDSPDFLPYLVTGIVAWNWFQRGVIAAANSIWLNAATIRQVALRKLVFPSTQLILATYRFGFSLLVLFGALLLFGYYPEPIWLLVVVPMFVQFVLTAAIGISLSAIIPFFPDLSSFVNYTLRLSFFLSAVMYKLESLPARWQGVLRFNPMVHILDAYRAPLLLHKAPDWTALAVIAAVSAATLALGCAMVNRFNGLYAKRIVR